METAGDVRVSLIDRRCYLWDGFGGREGGFRTAEDASSDDEDGGWRWRGRRGGVSH